MKTPDLQERAIEKPVGTEARQSTRRRSIRVVIDFPVIVFGQNSDGKILEQKTKTVTVNAHGALVFSETDLDSQKPALLVNTKTGTEVQCRIVYRKEIPRRGFEVGLEFINPYPRFWGMNFPPEDWDAADRKKVTSPSRPISASTKGVR
jgi:hypothetical protein